MSGPSTSSGTAWYRHFWPWFIVLLMAVSMSSALATVWLAYEGADPVVRDDWYKEGVAINRRLERQQRARALGLRAELEIDGGSGRLVVQLDGAGSDRVSALRLDLSHATLADRDLSLVLGRVAPRRFEVTPTGALEGRWYATLEPVPGDAETGDPDADWRLEAAFRLPSHRSIVFGDEG